jgi:hypothetical protein
MVEITPLDLKALYCWFHKTMRVAGKKLDPAEWCLYGTRPDTPHQTYSDCGFYTVLFGWCVAKRYFLKIINREHITEARCLLLLKLINLDPKKAKPLLHGPVGTKHNSWVLHPFHYVGEGLPYSDVPFSLILKNAMKNSDQAPLLDGYNGFGSHHNTPPKLLGFEDKHAVVNLMTPSSQPITPAVILNLTSPEQKLTQPLGTTPEKDTEADTGETNNGKQGTHLEIKEMALKTRARLLVPHRQAVVERKAEITLVVMETVAVGEANMTLEVMEMVAMTLTTQTTAIQELAKGVKRKRKGVHRKKSRRVNHQRDHLPAISRLPRLPRIRHSQTLL